MKKLAVLLIASGLLLGASTSANAIDFKMKGRWVMAFDYGQHGNFSGGNGQTGWGKSGEDEFEARQRVRIQMDAVASESLKAELVELTHSALLNVLISESSDVIEHPDR